MTNAKGARLKKLKNLWFRSHLLCKKKFIDKPLVFLKQQYDAEETIAQMKLRAAVEMVFNLH